VWLPDKLSRAVTWISAVPSFVPAALFAGRLICDAALRGRTAEPLPLRRPSFRNALVQNIMPGNTVVMNRSAADLCARTTVSAQDIVAHDWWIYQMITGASGHILHDPRQVVLYRQHDANAIGANLGAGSLLRRGLGALRGKNRTWTDAHLQALAASACHLSPENRQILTRYSRARSAPFWQRARLIRDLGLYRQSRTGQAMLWVQTLTGQL
jgi:hypothetical protein